MKQKIIIPLLLAFLSAFTVLPPVNTTIVTSTGTFVLTPPEKCINSNCLNGVIRTAELAGAAVAADVTTASNEEKSLSREIQSAGQAYDVAGKKYDVDKAPYDATLAVYSGDVTAYNAQTTRTVAQKSALDARKAVLDQQRDVLLVQWNSLQSLKTDLNSKLANINGVNDKINKALEQLKLCKKYAERAIEVSKTKKWGSYRAVSDCFGTLRIIPSIELLNTELEEMKAWSNKEWD